MTGFRQLTRLMTPDAELKPLFAGWIEDHAGILHKVAQIYARNEVEAEEMRHEMLTQLWVSAPTYNRQAKVSTWIYRVCLNTALMWRRGVGRRERRFDTDADVEQLGSGAANPAESAARTDLLTQLYRAIHRLTDSDRALVLLMLDGLAYREIAEVTGLTENHVGVALTRARKRLAGSMKGLTDELG